MGRKEDASGLRARIKSAGVQIQVLEQKGIIDIWSIQLWFGMLIGSFSLLYFFWQFFIVESDPMAHFPAHMRAELHEQKELFRQFGKRQGIANQIHIDKGYKKCKYIIIILCIYYYILRDKFYTKFVTPNVCFFAPNFYFLAPNFCFFKTKFFILWHQIFYFLTPHFLFFDTKFLLFDTKFSSFFTPIFLFFLHEIFAFLTPIFFQNFRFCCEKIKKFGVKMPKFWRKK